MVPREQFRFCRKPIGRTTKLLYVRTKMPRGDLCPRTFPRVSARSQIPIAHWSSSAGLAVFEGTESLCSNLRLVRGSDGISDCDRICSRHRNSIADALSRLESTAIDSEVSKWSLKKKSCRMRALSRKLIVLTRAMTESRSSTRMWQSRSWSTC